jgi:2,4-dienoyl-CoA reductase-like NADH-dependent reductase (Old Yellow Enzyme family)
MPRDPFPLTQPFQIGTLEIAGRLIKTATSETRAAPDGRCTPEIIDFYEPMARAGTPLIITGNIYISRAGQSTPLQMGADEDSKVSGLAELTAVMHRQGTKIFAQLSHCGRQVVPRFVGLPEAVSASNVRDFSIGTLPRPLTGPEIAGVVGEFAAAAARCKVAGFDGIQIHAGHGYLINQFLTPHTNRRRDSYGGDLENRTRLLREIYHAIRARVGAGFPVIIKLNGSDWLPLRRGLKSPEMVEIARIMEREGVDAVEVSVGQYESGFPVVRGTFWRCLRGMSNGSVPHLPQPWRLLFSTTWPLLAIICNLIWPRAQGYNLGYARQFKAALRIPVICVGGFVDREEMAAAVTSGSCDAVSSGRAFIADPHLFRHVTRGPDGPRCVFCNACVGRIGTEALDCFHPKVRREKDAMLEETGA